ncbi:MAG: hypothetical protein U9Q77_02450 [Candidatus Marinimicrobia bacterium]|nr:hypothetical protein [Candidatus Neomarinimicrobiota bacterium]
MDRRSLVYIAIFGTLWGICEATIGTTLHLLHIPLAGAILASIGMSIVLIARVYNPVRGATLLMALIAASIKMLSFSTVKLGPFVAIVIEGLLLEMVLTIQGTGRMAFMTSAIIVAIYPIFQTIMTKSIMFGSSFVPVILELVEGFSQRVGYQAGWLMLGLYLLIHFLFAFTAMIFSWKIIQRLKSDLEPV